MDQTHLHLLITHLPIFGSILGSFVLGYGIWSKSNHTKIAAYLLFLIAAIGAGIAYITGEGAEETVENIQGVSESIIDQHADFALIALIGLIVLGIASLISIFSIYKNSSSIKTTAIATLFISLVSFTLVARTGYLGGRIRHTEISSGAVINAASQQNAGEDED